MKYYIHAMRIRSGIHSRASRAEFWSFILCFAGISLIAIIVDTVLELPSIVAFAEAGPVQLGVFVAHLPALIVVNARRIHDTDRNGIWTILWLLGIGALVPLALAMPRGTIGDNRFGPDPYLDPNNISFTTKQQSAVTLKAQVGPHPGSSATISELEKLAQMRAKGHLTAIEFEALKSKIVNRLNER